MTRYTLGPVKADWWQDTFRTDVPTQTVHTGNDQHVDTGLVDPHGRAIVRQPNPIGFRLREGSK
jgi:hypothetical protein